MLVPFCETNTPKILEVLWRWLYPHSTSRGRIKFVLRIKIFVKVLTRASVSKTWKTCDRTAVNSGKPKFQFHILRQRKEMGRPGETCYVLILYFSYLEPYLLLHFFVFICLMQFNLIMYACTTTHLWSAFCNKTLTTMINHSLKELNNSNVMN